MSTQTEHGTIKSIVSDRGFGFIRPRDLSADVFFHATNLVGIDFAAVAVGDPVTFTVETVNGRPRAMDVRVPLDAPADRDDDAHDAAEGDEQAETS